MSSAQRLLLSAESQAAMVELSSSVFDGVGASVGGVEELGEVVQASLPQLRVQRRFASTPLVRRELSRSHLFEHEVLLPEDTASAQPYHLQGDAALHTAEALAARRAIKDNALVRLIIEQYWRTYEKTHDGTIGRDVYLDVHEKLAKALSVDVTPEERRANALSDWEADMARNQCDEYGRVLDTPVQCEGMTRAAYFQSLFELVDLWTVSVDPREYTSFLLRLYERVTEPSEDGDGRQWRSTDEVVAPTAEELDASASGARHDDDVSDEQLEQLCEDLIDTDDGVENELLRIQREAEERQEAEARRQEDRILRALQAFENTAWTPDFDDEHECIEAERDNTSRTKRNKGGKKKTKPLSKRARRKLASLWLLDDLDATAAQPIGSPTHAEEDENTEVNSAAASPQTTKRRHRKRARPRTAGRQRPAPSSAHSPARAPRTDSPSLDDKHSRTRSDFVEHLDDILDDVSDADSSHDATSARTLSVRGHADASLASSLAAAPASVASTNSLAAPAPLAANEPLRRKSVVSVTLSPALGDASSTPHFHRRSIFDTLAAQHGDGTSASTPRLPSTTRRRHGAFARSSVSSLPSSIASAIKKVKAAPDPVTYTVSAPNLDEVFGEYEPPSRPRTAPRPAAQVPASVRVQLLKKQLRQQFPDEQDEEEVVVHTNQVDSGLKRNWAPSYSRRLMQHKRRPRRPATATASAPVLPRREQIKPVQIAVPLQVLGLEHTLSGMLPHRDPAAEQSPQRRYFSRSKQRPQTAAPSARRKRRSNSPNKARPHTALRRKGASKPKKEKKAKQAKKTKKKKKQQQQQQQQQQRARPKSAVGRLSVAISAQADADEFAAYAPPPPPAEYATAGQQLPAALPKAGWPLRRPHTASAVRRAQPRAQPRVQPRPQPRRRSRPRPRRPATATTTTTASPTATTTHSRPRPRARPRARPRPATASPSHPPTQHTVSMQTFSVKIPKTQFYEEDVADEHAVRLLKQHMASSRYMREGARVRVAMEARRH